MTSRSNSRSPSTSLSSSQPNHTNSEYHDANKNDDLLVVVHENKNNDDNLQAQAPYSYTSFPAGVTENDIEEFREIFTLVDRDGGGSISVEELGDLLDIVGIESTPAETERIATMIDTDNSGEIEFDEFAAVMMKRVEPGYTSQEMKEAFEIVKQNSNSIHKHKDKVHVDDIVQFLMSQGSSSEGVDVSAEVDVNSDVKEWNEERIRALVLQMDADQDGFVAFEEYVNLMMNW